MSVSAFALVGAGAAQAQAPAPSSTGAATDGVEEIVVTARKQSETIVQAPVAVSALSGEDLSKRGVQGLIALSDFVPGFKFQNQSVNRNDRGFTHFSIRGMYAGTPSPDRQAASAFIDGVPIGNGSIAGLADVQQVEVVKGPQSAYFGRSTFAGAINFITRNPSFEPRADLDLSYSSYDTQEARASVEGAIIPDVLSARLSGRYFSTAGQYKNALTGERLGKQDTRAASLALYFTPTPKFRAKAFGIVWRDDDNSPASGQLAAADMNCTTPTGRRYFCGEISSSYTNRLIQQTYVGQTILEYVQGVRGPGRVTIEPGFVDHFGLKRRAHEGHASFDYDLPADFTLSGSASYFRDNWGYITDTGFQDGRGTRNTFFPAVADSLPYTSRTVGGQTKFTSKSAELRVTSPQDKRLRGLIGVSLYEQNNTQVTNAFQNQGPTVAVNPTTTLTQTVGYFGSVTLDVYKGLSVSAEGRQQADKLSQNVLITNGLRLSDKTKSFSPRIIVKYEFDQDRSVYASWARGTRPSQFNAFLYSLAPAAQAQVVGQAGVPLFVPEEQVEMSEVGLKGYFFERKLRVLAAAYMGLWTDKHISQTVGYFNPTFSTITVTVPGGKVSLRGIELEAVYKPNRSLTFEGNFAYSETEIRNSFSTESLQLLNVANPRGNRLPFYPAYTASLAGTYDWRIGDYDAFIRADYVYTGRIYESEANLAWTAPAHRVNLRAGARRGNYGVELFVNNLFDNDTPIALASNLDSFTSARTLTFSPAVRRVVGVRVTAGF